MYLAAGSVVTLLIVGGIASAMGAEDGAGSKMRPAANFAVEQAVGDPRVMVQEAVWEMSVEQACNAGADEQCQEAQQSYQLIAPLSTVVSVALFLALIQYVAGSI